MNLSGGGGIGDRKDTELPVAAVCIRTRGILGAAIEYFSNGTVKLPKVFPRPMMAPEPDRQGPDSSDHPGVRMPPPALFLGALLVGIGLEWLWPLAWIESLSASLRYGLGGGLALAGAAIMAAALRLFRKEGTAIPPWEPATALVTTGVYRRSRNPIYVGMVLLYLGLALLFAATWALLLLIPVLIVLQLTVIRREEAYLERRFGAAYRDYRARVRRWL